MDAAVRSGPGPGRSSAAAAVRPGPVALGFRPPGTLVGLLALYACWGSSIPAMKLMVRGVPPLTGAGAVFTLGGVLLLVAGRRAPRPTLVQSRRIAASGVLLLGAQGLATVALTRLTASLAAVLAATVPLWVAGISMLRGARVTRLALTRLLAGFLGVVVIIGTAPASALGGSALAVAATLAATMCWALGTVRSADATAAPIDPRVTSAIQMISGGVVLLVLAAVLGQWSGHALSHMTAGSLGAAAFLLLIDSLAGFALYQHLLQTAPLPLVSSYSYATPVVAAALSIAIFGDHAWLGLGLGAAMIIAATYSEVRARPR